jgi:nitroreductase
VSQDISLLDAIYTTRAIRLFTPDPVPLETVYKVIEAATMGPSGRNSQGWHFAVVDDPELKQKIGEYYLDGYASLRGELNPEGEDPSVHLAKHMGEAPVLIVVCAPHRPGVIGSPRLSLPVYAAVYPAIQNLLLAARAYDIGGVLTVNHEGHTEDIKQLLGLPEVMNIFAIVPLGYTKQRHGKKSRKPVAAVTSYNGWGQPLPIEA